MSTTNTLSSGLPDAEHSAQLRKAVIAATVGTTIEWYDFFIYGTAAGLVFPKLFFPNADPLTGTLAAFSTYFIGFVGRPIGAAIFGHFGDRIGRKATLISTLLLMGIATFLVALVPGYDSIGVWGAIILTALRTLQGIGVGGEWGGSVLISMEWSRTHARRGLVASWPQFGVPCGLFLSNLVILAFSAWSGADFIAWGWRVPFLLSIVLIGIGLWIRIGILETPVFKQLVDTNLIEKTPILEVIKKQPREIILSALVRMAEQAPFYIFTAFIFAYGTGTLKMSRELVLTAVLVASVVSFVSIPLSGHISDRIGRRKMYLIGAARNRRLRLRLFRHAGQRRAGACVLGNRAIAHTTRHDVRAAGGADRRSLHASAALQRRIVGLPACFGYCRRPGAADRDGADCNLSHGLCCRVLHRRLRRHQPDLCRVDAGLYRQGHLGGIRCLDPVPLRSRRRWPH